MYPTSPLRRPRMTCPRSLSTSWPWSGPQGWTCWCQRWLRTPRSGQTPRYGHSPFCNDCNLISFPTTSGFTLAPNPNILSTLPGVRSFVWYAQLVGEIYDEGYQRDQFSKTWVFSTLHPIYIYKTHSVREMTFLPPGLLISNSKKF